MQQVPAAKSSAALLASLPPSEQAAILDGYTDAELEQLAFDWRFWARDAQKPPEGDWLTWLILAGRGFGKTRTGAEWVREQIDAGYSRIALVAPTAADARDTMVEGESGILATSPKWNRPLYEPSKRRLTWPNGAMATLFSAEEPERLRGPQHDAAWCDELAAWARAQEAWDMLQFGLRLGRRPRQLITTTPKPIPTLKAIIAAPTTVTTRGSTSENAANLAPSFLEQIVGRFAGTRLGRQELEAELLDDVPGALWTRAMVDDAKKPHPPFEFVRIVVAVDPSGTKGDSDGGDAIGIVVAGRTMDGRAHVIADRTCKLSPDGWGRRAVEAYKEFGADRIVAERNYGGAMVEHVIRTVDQSVSYKEVTASRGKAVRAEPVAALYEQKKVTHTKGDNLLELEDEMCQMTGSGFLGAGSPNRVDALVWALTELMLAPNQFDPNKWIRAFS
jgi:phage terminase large subunit-like protein